MIGPRRRIRAAGAFSAFNPDTSYGFFNNGGGGYVVLDLSAPDTDRAVLFWTDAAPHYGERFWDLVDEWTVASLSG